jgi:hypothetical protein
MVAALVVATASTRARMMLSEDAMVLGIVDDSAVTNEGHGGGSAWVYL